ncbi:Histidine kinase-, DNA gyrase B-, and HSP90-like ATPase [Natronincola peptidivorans]|uniref:histidine kinase n=1 Tax=Natronincola peptidivorans TaxID=426128 RepID=A0A1H9Z1K7_9FIRM|nr:ATP-binding protein [Natronincola peptidivorans]SES75274.1 Histidine kinase-, DNA gyrase B-, and HSP90-like ATPase [Natronincola peptidivorans]
MKELALHILDIVQNSVRADASIIEITVREDIQRDILMISIKDNGKGMDEETLKKVEDPFFTTRTTRKIGLGISLFKTAALQCNGSFNLVSKQGEGTCLTAAFQYSHIDRAPLGNIVDTLVTLLMMEKEIDYRYVHYYKNNQFSFDTHEIKKVLDGVPITDINVVEWIKEYITEGLKEIVNF